MQVNHTMTQLMTELETLRAEVERQDREIERLRAALREILDVVAVTASGAEICQCSDFDFARAALEANDD